MDATEYYTRHAVNHGEAAEIRVGAQISGCRSTQVKSTIVFFGCLQKAVNHVVLSWILAASAHFAPSLGRCLRASRWD